MPLGSRSTVTWYPDGFVESIGPSEYWGGCISEDYRRMFAEGLGSAEELKRRAQHLAQCEMCRSESKLAKK